LTPDKKISTANLGYARNDALRLLAVRIARYVDKDNACGNQLPVVTIVSTLIMHKLMVACDHHETWKIEKFEVFIALP